MPNTIDSRDNNAPWNQEELPPLTELEEEVSDLRNKIKGMVKKSDIIHILESYSESNPRYAIIKLKKLLEL